MASPTWAALLTHGGSECSRHAGCGSRRDKVPLLRVPAEVLEDLQRGHMGTHGDTWGDAEAILPQGASLRARQGRPAPRRQGPRERDGGHGEVSGRSIDVDSRRPQNRRGSTH